MVYQPRKKEHLTKEQPMGDAVIAYGPYTRVEQYFPA